MHNFKLTYKLFGESAILIEWPTEISEIILTDILDFKNAIENQLKLKDCIVGYNSILLVYDFVIINSTTKIDSLKELYQNKKSVKNKKRTHWRIPVCYDVTFGIDLEIISKELKLSQEEIIYLHTKETYTVYFIGFYLVFYT